VVELTRGDALFLDFDGTLTAIQDDADTVALPLGGAQTLLDIFSMLDGALCLISGRDRDDLAARVPDTLPLMGNHGMRRRFIPGGTDGHAPSDLLSKLNALAGDGIYIEPKAAVIAIHYRQAPESGDTLLADVKDIVGHFPDYRVEHGKCVIEAKPAAASKGGALRDAMQIAPFMGRRPVMIGDDTTDESAFAAAQGLGGVGIKVGKGPTCADSRLACPDDVFALLVTLT